MFFPELPSPFNHISFFTVLCFWCIWLWLPVYPFLLSSLSHISTTAIVHHILPISLSVIPNILHLWRRRFHYPSVSLLNSSSHHFILSMRSLPKTSFHGSALHSALLVMCWLIWFNFLTKIFSTLLTLHNTILSPLCSNLLSFFYGFLKSALISSSRSPQMCLLCSDHCISSILISDLSVHATLCLLRSILLDRIRSARLGSVWFRLIISTLYFVHM